MSTEKVSLTLDQELVAEARAVPHPQVRIHGL